MSSVVFNWPLFRQVPIVGILRGVAPELMVDIGQICIQAGMANLEITLNSPRVFESISILRQRFTGKLNIGAGTVNSPEDLARAVNSGAQFIVTPTTLPPVISAACKAGVPIFPGALSPTEILTAWQLGASAVKIFPAGQVGYPYVKAIHEAMPHIDLLPTGGVSLTNMQDFHNAGAIGFGIGSPLFPPDILKSRDWPALLSHIHKYVECARSFTPHTL